jgi:hypothetical protein
MDDRIVAATWRERFGVTVTIVKCVAIAALFTAAVWFITSYTMDSVFFR